MVPGGLLASLPLSFRSEKPHMPYMASFIAQPLARIQAPVCRPCPLPDISFHSRVGFQTAPGQPARLFSLGLVTLADCGRPCSGFRPTPFPHPHPLLLQLLTQTSYLQAHNFLAILPARRFSHQLPDGSSSAPSGVPPRRDPLCVTFPAPEPSYSILLHST